MFYFSFNNSGANCQLAFVFLFAKLALCYHTIARVIRIIYVVIKPYNHSQPLYSAVRAQNILFCSMRWQSFKSISPTVLQILLTFLAVSKIAFLHFASRFALVIIFYLLFIISFRYSIDFMSALIMGYLLAFFVPVYPDFNCRCFLFFYLKGQQDFIYFVMKRWK